MYERKKQVVEKISKTIPISHSKYVMHFNAVEDELLKCREWMKFYRLQKEKNILHAWTTK